LQFKTVNITYTCVKQIIVETILKTCALKVVQILTYSLAILWKYLVEKSIEFLEE
jgi:vacuolar-type H+-ATPase subunit C/Vma6